MGLDQGIRAQGCRPFLVAPRQLAHVYDGGPRFRLSVCERSLHLLTAFHSLCPTAAADPAPYTAWPGTPEQEALAAKMFSAKAAGYGSFILLLYFSLAAIWCMCYMPVSATGGGAGART